MIPEDGSADYRDLEAMVHSINETQVMPADRLSDHVYHYERKSGTFELAYKTALRKKCVNCSTLLVELEGSNGFGQLLLPSFSCI